VYIKYHFLADDGQKQFTADEAMRLSGEDPDYSKRGLWRAIERGEKVSWTAHVQVMDSEDADPEKLGFDPFDVTKVWPKTQFPVHAPHVPSVHVSCANRSNCLVARVWEADPEPQSRELPQRC
jgi:catalase